MLNSPVHLTSYVYIPATQNLNNHWKYLTPLAKSNVLYWTAHLHSLGCKG